MLEIGTVVAAIFLGLVGILLLPILCRWILILARKIFSLTVDLFGIEKPIERLEEPLSLGEEEPGYDPVTGEMVIYRPWANFTIFYGDFRYSPELVPLGKVESGLEVLSSKTEDFKGVLELMEAE